MERLSVNNDRSTGDTDQSGYTSDSYEKELHDGAGAMMRGCGGKVRRHRRRRSRRLRRRELGREERMRVSGVVTNTVAAHRRRDGQSGRRCGRGRLRVGEVIGGHISDMIRRQHTEWSLRCCIPIRRTKAYEEAQWSERYERRSLMSNQRSAVKQMNERSVS